MLHIMFMILKIIGIVLAVILGIILALLLIVLFVPFGYEVSGTCDGDMKDLQGEAKISWLFHLIGGSVIYQNKKVCIKARIAWKNINLSDDSKEEKKSKKKNEEPQAEIDEPEESVKEAPQQKTKESGKEEPQQETKDSVQEEVEQGTKVLQNTVKEEKTIADPVLEEKEKDVIKEEAEEPEKQEHHEEEKKTGKIQGQIDKIKQTIESFCDKIKVLKTKKDTVVDFIKNEIHKRAFLKVKKELIKLIKCVCPKKAGGDVTFGFEDPYTTGQILAGASILYPFYFEHLTLRPDFENQIIKGNLFLKGRIYIVSFVGIGLRLLLCKDIRITYKDIRNFKL